MSSRVEDRCDKVLERLKKKIREINERPANAPIPSRRPIVSRPSAEKKKEEEEKRSERKKRPRPTSNEDSKTEKKRARTVNEDEEKKEQEDVMEIENDDNDEREDQNTIALPKIVASTAALSTPTSITKKKKKTKKKKSVRFNLNLNTTHFVPFKEKSTLRRNGERSSVVSCRAQLLAKKKGMEDSSKSLVFGASTEIEWTVPALVGGFTPTELEDKSEIERMQERRNRLERERNTRSHQRKTSGKSTAAGRE